MSNKRVLSLISLAAACAALASCGVPAPDGGARHDGARQGSGQETARRGGTGSMSGVTRSVQLVDSGSVMTLTSTDPATVAKLQAQDWTARRGPDAGADVTVTNLPDGVRVEVTSTDAQAVARIQAAAQGRSGSGARR